MAGENERRSGMSINQAATKDFSSLCCRAWSHQRYPARKKKIGILLVTIGLIWLGARAGLLDFSWLQAVYFWPAVLILMGAWLVYKGSMRGIPRTISKKTTEE
jgi:hypothetical protein